MHTPSHPLFALRLTHRSFQQHHYNSAFEAGISAQGYALPGDYRGIAVFEGESYEKILEVFLSDEYKRLAYDDETNYIDRSKSVFLPGSLTTFVDRSN